MFASYFFTRYVTVRVADPDPPGSALFLEAGSGGLKALNGVLGGFID
jgi:hypothetical protein